MNFMSRDEIPTESSGEPRVAPPTCQTWVDMETNAPGQPNFVELTVWPTVAERAYLKLVDNYHEGLASLDIDEPWRPLSLREMAYGCLSLAVEYGRNFTDVARQRHYRQRLTGIPWLAATRCREESVEALTWLLVEQAMSSNEDAERQLIVGLTAGYSEYRMLNMELAWFTRALLPAETIIPRLLKNVAETLGYWWEAVGLSREFAGTLESWEKHVAEYVPEDLPEQFATRIGLAKEMGPAAATLHFIQTECRVRKQVEAIIFPSVLFRCPYKNLQNGEV